MSKTAIFKILHLHYYVPRLCDSLQWQYNDNDLVNVNLYKICQIAQIIQIAAEEFTHSATALDCDVSSFIFT